MNSGDDPNSHVAFSAAWALTHAMKFADSFLDEIRARLPVSQVVSRHVPLKRRGREFVGLSPFNKEKTPSFTVNDQ